MITDMNIISPMGKPKWDESTVRGILCNVKYCGDVLQGKTYTIDAVIHMRVINNGKEYKYFVIDHHESIISKEDWNKVQDILKTRTNLRLTGRTGQFMDIGIDMIGVLIGVLVFYIYGLLVKDRRLSINS